MTAWWLVLACAPESPEDSGAPADGDEPGAPALEPVWSADEAMAQARAALDQGLPDPYRLRDLYFDLVEAGQDADCPGPDLLNTPNLQGCTSDTGYFYAGLATYQEGTNASADESWMFSGDFEIITPEGWSYLVGGHAAHTLDASDSDHVFYQVDVSGSFRWDGDPGWLAEGLSAVFSVEGTRSPAGDDLTLDGGTAFAGVSLYWSEVHVVDDACEGHPSGSLDVRDPSGGWYTLTWGGTCDGCGAVSFAGEPAGEACLDLRSAVGAFADGVAG